ncbi:DUF5776 domain-containing protein [Levilactobacillus yonginensis]|uniref:DUF5776 domain-containing protein n=1 Tax=Levilactobacillus yonginensis TaxID=1054041 RepID=UPI000F77B22D|nr:DUF5776 domain-containing protein [Levilactobacillus yonginensis]
MRWHNGLLVLAATVGVGLAGSTWSEVQTVPAQAAMYTFNLQPVDKENDEKIVDTKHLDISLSDLGFNENTTYGDILDKYKALTTIDYRAALNSFSLLNNDQISATNRLWGLKYQTAFTDEFGGVTSGISNLLYADWRKGKDEDAQRYTIDSEGFKNNLEEPFKKSTSTINVPFSKSTVRMTIKVVNTSGHTLSLNPITVYGMPGDTLDLEDSNIKSSLDLVTKDKYVLSSDSVTFDENSDSTKTITVIPKDDVKTVAIKYVDKDGKELAKSKVLKGHGSSTQTIKSPTIEGFKTENESVTVNFGEYDTGDENAPIEVIYTSTDQGETPGGGGGGNGGGSETPGGGDENEDGGGTDVDTGNNGNGNGSGSGSGSGTAVTPFKIYGKQKLYRYTNPTFQNHQRVQGHAKKTRAHAPVFTVVKKTTSKNGAARYQLSDGSHVTANSKYVANLYWKGNNYKTLHVTNPKGVNVHRNTGLTSKVRHMKQGTAIKVAKVVKVGQTTRYQLPNGNYITGSKKYVSPTKPKTVQKVKAKTTVRVYKDVNLTKVAKTYKKGATIKVSGWDHSHGDKTHRSGVKRYKVAGGFITANSKYVKVVK